MMDGFGDLQDLYQQVILDHGRAPRNFHDMPDATHKADGYNPLCGDQVTIFCKVEDGKIADLSFIGKGCAICTASASMMTQSLKNQPLKDANHVFEGFHHMLTEGGEGCEKDLGKLGVFIGVRKYPMRVKCATLAWHTLQSSLNNGESITTE